MLKKNETNVERDSKTCSKKYREDFGTAKDPFNDIRLKFARSALDAADKILQMGP